MSRLSDASKTLSDNNIDAEIIDLRSLSPIDYKTIGESVKTNKLVAVDTSRRNGGIMSEAAMYKKI